VNKLLSRLLSRRGVATSCLLLVSLLLVRPQAERVRWRVSHSISLALAKRVQVGSLHLRFLPQLGFDLQDFVIYDDPSFGSEPLLRAEDVTASLRVMSLLRGRFEFSSLSLNNASVNLTRDSQGKWNLQDLLQRTAQIPTAPTASFRRESRPEFPYIEASRARINFKIGVEKTHFAFTDAEFGLWQQSEDVWSMRLKARPIRTDTNLTDVGVINIKGSWHRSTLPATTPVEFAFQWKQAQAGQISRLISGEDKGWRGGVLISGTLSGTSRNLSIVADTSVDDLGRYDVFNGDSMHLAARCVAKYSATDGSFSDLDCASPVGRGSLRLKGIASGLPISSYDLTLTGSEVPTSAVLALLRHATAGVSDNLSVDGVLNSEIQISRAAPGLVQWQGDGELLGLALRAGNASLPLRLDRVPFSIVSGSDNAEDIPSDGSPRIEVGPASVLIGRPSPLQAKASVSLTGYRAWVRGDAGIRRLLQVAQMLSIPTPAVTADGASTVDLGIAGTWAGDAAPLVSGTAQLRNVRAQVRGLNAPLDVRSATLVLSKDTVRIQNINATAADAQWRGSLVIPRPCPTPRDCTLQFSMHAGEVDAASLNNLLNPSARKQSWYKLLSLGEKPMPYLLQARITGKLSIDKLKMGSSSASQLSGDITLEQGKLTVTDLRSAVLGGKVAGELKADFLARPPTYRGSGTFEDVSLGQVSDSMHDTWVDGTGSANCEFKSAGWSLADLMGAAELNLDFAIADASFPHVVLTSKAGPLRVNTFSGRLSLQDSKFSFQGAKLEAATGIYNVSGTASLTGALNLKMVSEGATGYNLSGTLTKTRVSQVAATSARASLRP
jgi:hypothetical protein